MLEGLRLIDNLGSVRAVDAPVEAICWAHRGGGWDVHYTSDHPLRPGTLPDGRAVNTRREAYALVRELRDAWHKADRLALMNDPRAWD